MTPEWVNDYIGIPFGEPGPDGSLMKCWGLVRRVLGERLGVEVPDYGNDATEVSQGTAVDEAIRRGCDDGALWGRIEKGCERLGDVVVFRVGRSLWHVGLVIGSGWMLHTMKSAMSCRGRYMGPEWRERIEGFYRYKGSRDAGVA